MRIMRIPNDDNAKNQVSEPFVTYKGFAHKSEDEKLLEDVRRPDLEKLKLFCKMLRRNAALKKAVIVNNLSK